MKNCLRTLFVFVFAIVGAAAARAELPPTLEAALKAGEDIPETRWAFTQSFKETDKDGALEVVLRYDPLATDADQLQLLSPAEGDLSEKQSQILETFTTELEKARADGKVNISASYLMYDDVRDLLRNGVSVMSESADEIVYQFAPAADEGDKDSERFMKNLSGEMTVAKSKPYVKSFRIYAKEPFKPAAVAKLETFEQIVEFDPPAADGRPPFMRRTISNISGSAMFQAFESITELVITDIVRRD